MGALDLVKDGACDPNGLQPNSDRLQPRYKRRWYQFPNVTEAGTSPIVEWVSKLRMVEVKVPARIEICGVSQTLT